MQNFNHITNLKKLKKYVSKDEMRPQLHNIFYNAKNKELVSTDGHTMLIMKNDLRVENDLFINPKTFEESDYKGDFVDYEFNVKHMIKAYNKVNVLKELKIIKDAGRVLVVVEWVGGLLQCFDYKKLKEFFKTVVGGVLYTGEEERDPIRGEFGFGTMFLMPMRHDCVGEEIANFTNIETFLKYKLEK